MPIKIKPSQLTRVGYSYQDLFCIKLLVDWYHEPDKYQWISVESADTELGKFKGLDDVVALNHEGKYELYQVKFTTDSQRDDLTLSFDWLLTKKKRGTSLLQKWAHDVEKYATNDHLATAALKTNRIPNEEVTNALNGGVFLDITNIPEKSLEIIDYQLGGRGKTEAFFSRFEFHHSQKEFDNLEASLHDSLVPDHTTEEGWLRFLKSVERWATRKNQPIPNGKIKISHIDELLKTAISQSLSQFFEIPKGYTPPSEDFHNDIVEKTKKTGSWVISGRPGMGKSTYLSYLTEMLSEQGIPVVRHHYSLSSQSVVDRISFMHAARSIQIQLRELYPDLFSSDEPKPDELNKWIRKATQKSSQPEKQLVIILDGLDHVARERSDISQLEHLANRLLPFRDHICLIFGTQPISDVALPSQMASRMPRKIHWIDLPAMDMQAIRNWLEAMSDDNQILLLGNEKNKSSELSSVAEALHKISGGYPLYLIYSLRQLAARERYISKYDVEKLPLCPEGDIIQYYDVLWSNLSAEAREILLQISCVEFQWPDRDSLGSCFSDSLKFSSAFDEVQHLFESRSSGITPFHSSIIAYLKNREEFSQLSISLMKRAKQWLDSDTAPEYWKWGWQWVIDSNLENPEPLLNGLTREWLIDSFCKGYPLTQIEHIFSLAESLAFDLDRYPDLIRLRLIKIRLINGPEFQLQKYHEFLKQTLTWNQESYALLWRVDNLHTLDNQEISVVASLSEDNEEITQKCFDEIIKRIRFYVKSGNDNQHENIDGLIDAAFETLITSPSPDLDKVFWLLNKLNDKETYFSKIIKKILTNRKEYLVLDIPLKEIPEESQSLYWDNFVLACCNMGISFIDRPEREKAQSSIYGILCALLSGQKINVSQLTAPSDVTSKKAASYTKYRNIFFFTLVNQLHNLTEINFSTPYKHTDADSFAIKAEEFFKYAAHITAVHISKDEGAGIFDAYGLIKEMDFPQRLKCNYDESQVWHAISKALTHISISLYRLMRCTGLLHPTVKNDFEILHSNDWWIATNWLKAVVEMNAVDLVPAGVSESEISDAYDEISSFQENTSTLANDCLDLTKLASSYHLIDLSQHCMRLTAQHALGYGYRKDPTLDGVYEAIDACAKQGVGNVSDWLQRLGSFTHEAGHYTEKSINHIPKWHIDLLSRVSPGRLVDEFSYYLENHDWSTLQDILYKFIEHFPLDTLAEKSLLRSQTSFESLEKLKERAADNVDLKHLLDSQIDFLGGLPPSPREQTYSDPYTEKEIDDVDIEEYPPRKLKELCEALREQQTISADNFIESWINFWDSKGEGLDVIAAYEQLLSEDVDFPYLLRRSVGMVVSLSLKLRGSKKSYDLVIRNIQENNMWDRYFGSGSVKEILKYAEIYKRDWRIFLHDSLSDGSFNSRESKWVIVPTCELVKLFLAIGQSNLAIEITEVMVKCLEDETSHLPLPPLQWIQAPIPQNEIASRLLLLYFKWPDRLARLRTANEIAKLLDQDEAFRPIFLDHLGQLKYEVDITDHLSILLLTASQFFSKEELLSAIKFPSILSNLILDQLGHSHKINSLQCYSGIDVTSYSEPDNFIEIQNGFPGIYFHYLDEIGKKYNYPLRKHLAAEWECITFRKSVHSFYPYAFCGDRLYPQDRILCSFSTQAECTLLSAYLRTLAFAHTTLGLSYEEVAYFASEAKPFGVTYSSILPSSKPKGWSDLDTFEKDEALPNQSGLTLYLEGLINQDDVLIAANGPVCRGISSVCCDLKVIAIGSEQEISAPAEALFRDLQGRHPHPDGIYKLAHSNHLGDTGRWDLDRFMRGYYEPEILIGIPPGNREVTDQAINYYAGDFLNAKWQYWHHNWYPVFYSGLEASLGTCLTMPNDAWEMLKENTGDNFYLLGRLRIVDKRDYNPEVVPHDVYAIINFQ
ncbi:AAA family ATPase [Pseudomonadota bacterium]